MKKPALTIDGRSLRAGVVLASLSLVLGACGGGGASGAPDDATEDEFCKVYDSLFGEILADVDAEADEAAQAKAIVAGLKMWAGQLNEVGTPEDISEEARTGFELSMESIGELDDESSPADLESLGENFSDADQEAGDAFDSYATETCGDLVGGSGIDQPEE